MKPLPLAALIWILTPGSEHHAIYDLVWDVCEATAGDDAWRCEGEWMKEGSEWRTAANGSERNRPSIDTLS